MEWNRRQLLQASASACTAAMISGGGVLLGQPAAAKPAQALRPPGALPEDQFLGACIRCGLCVRDCPPGNLKLSQWGGSSATDLSGGVAIGTPYFEARDIPCEMCEQLPCVKACPTGALDHKLSDIAQARMGLAVLIDQENCLNFLGLRCDVCYRVCPLIDKAITLQRQSNTRSDRHAMFLPTVHADACTGCGKCEKACVLERAAIKVLPIDLARGELGHHYRKGWAANNQAGRPHFEQPTQNLPQHAVPGDLVPLRSGAPAYSPPTLGAASSPATGAAP